MDGLGMGKERNVIVGGYCNSFKGELAKKLTKSDQENQEVLLS